MFKYNIFVYNEILCYRYSFLVGFIKLNNIYLKMSYSNIINYQYYNF